MSQGHCGCRLRAVNTSDTGKFCFKMSNRALVRIVLIEITEGALEQTKDFRFVMFNLSADFDQFDEIGCGLSAPMVGSNSCEGVGHHDLAQGMQIRSAASRDR